MNEFLSPKSYYLACMEHSNLPTSVVSEKTAGYDEKTALATAFFNQLVLDRAAKVDAGVIDTLREDATKLAASYEDYTKEYVKTAEDTANKMADYITYCVNNYNAINETNIDVEKFATVAALQLQSRKEASFTSNTTGIGAGNASATARSVNSSKTGSDINPWLIAGGIAAGVALGAGALHYLKQPNDEVLKVKVHDEKDKEKDKPNG